MSKLIKGLPIRIREALITTPVGISHRDYVFHSIKPCLLVRFGVNMESACIIKSLAPSCHVSEGAIHSLEAAVHATKAFPPVFTSNSVMRKDEYCVHWRMSVCVCVCWCVLLLGGGVRDAAGFDGE